VEKGLRIRIKVSMGCQKGLHKGCQKGLHKGCQKGLPKRVAKKGCIRVCQKLPGFAGVANE